MKTSKSGVIIAVVSISILIVSLAVMLMDVLIPWNFWAHPAINFLFCLFSGFGILALVLGIKRSSPVFYFISALLLGLAVFYAVFQYAAWWVALIITLVIWAIFSIISLVTAGNKTESIALNNSKDYKDYAQRKAEKQAENEKKETEPLPEIKSFK